MIIKFLLVPALVFAVWAALRSRASLRGQARRKLLAGLTVVVGVLAVIFPDATQWAADIVGVTRGTDLLLYVLALVLIYLVGSTGVRFREQEARLVRLSRQVALAEAEARIGLGVTPGFHGPGGPSGPGGPGHREPAQLPSPAPAESRPQATRT